MHFIKEVALNKNCNLHMDYFDGADFHICDRIHSGDLLCRGLAIYTFLQARSNFFLSFYKFKFGAFGFAYFYAQLPVHDTTTKQ